MQQVIQTITTKINEQTPFIKACMYILICFLILLIGYGFGRLIGLIFI